MVNKILIDTKNINKSTYAWNAISSIISATQSVILLMIIPRVIGTDYAGVFSFAWTFAYLMLTIGNFNARYYQVTDMAHKYSIEDYVSSRKISCVVMIVVSIAFPVWGIWARGYSTEKALVILLTCVWKLSDAIDDVYHGWFQQKGRLDIACKILTIRYTLGIIVYSIVLIATRSIVIATISAALISLACLLMTLRCVPHFGSIDRCNHYKTAIRVLKECAPLCATAFLITYISNAPKYAIDAYLTEEIQAYYNYIFMPVFAIGLVASFIYNPIVTKLGEDWQNGNVNAIKNVMKKQAILISAITMLAILFGWLIGIPVLQLLYATKLSMYKIEFCLLLLGGGIYAYICLLAIIITTMRGQKALMIGYAIVAIMAKLMSRVIVVNSGLMGAARFYLLSMVILCVVLISISTSYLKRTRG